MSFRVALSGDFRQADGTPTFPDFDLAPLAATPGLEYAYIPCKGGEVAARELAGFDALILLMPKFTRASIPADARLSVVARFGVGYDNVDVEACTENGIAVVITPDGVRRPVAVSIITLMLALTGKLLIKDRLTRAGPEGFNRRAAHMGTGLVGKTLASVGVGNIGAEMFRLAKPFDMRFIACDPYLAAEGAAALGVELVDLDAVFRRGDVIAVNCPLSPHTRRLVDARLISLMKPSAFLINTARGPIVDQRALAEALAAGRIAGAGLDVFDPEPPEADDPILKLENVILTPHALCWTDQCFAGNGAADVAAVLAIKRGEVPAGIVDRRILDHPGWRKKLAGYRAQLAP